MANASTRLERRRQLDRAWLRYVQDGILPEGVAADISESWRRARDAYGIDPGLRRPKVILSPEDLDERRREDEVLAVAAPILREFTGRLERSGRVLAYFDAGGVMLRIGGDDRVVDLVQGIGFQPGADWSEASAGTNGPGTALAEARAVEVFASEHFVEAWQRWTCSAAPVLAPGAAAPAGLVDITGPWETQPRQALLVAKAIARAVEERLRAVVIVREEVVRYAFREAHGSGDALVAVDARGRVLAVNDAAARGRLLHAGRLDPAAQQLVASAMRRVRGGLEGDVRLELPAGGALLASAVRYQGAAVGAILRAPRHAPPPHPERPARGGEAPSPGGSLRSAIDASERAALVEALEESGWNVVRAAGRLGVSRMTLYRRMQWHGISRADADLRAR